MLPQEEKTEPEQIKEDNDRARFDPTGKNKHIFKEVPPAEETKSKKFTLDTTASA